MVTDDDDDDEDMREVMRHLTPERRRVVFQRGGIELEDWEAKEKKIPREFWSDLRNKGALTVSKPLWCAVDANLSNKLLGDHVG